MPKNNVLPKGEFFTTIPDHFLSQIMTELSASELRVMLYIYLHTLGYGKLNDAISYDQFLNGVTTRDGRKLDKGAGVCRRSLIPALATLEARGLISRQKQGYRAATIKLEMETPAKADNITVEIEQIEEQRDSSQNQLATAQIEQVQILPEIDTNSGQKMHSTCRESSKHEENINRGQNNPAELLEKTAIDLIIEKFPTLPKQVAVRLVKIALNKHGRDLAYIERILQYALNTPNLKNPLAVFTSLIKQDADRTLAGKARPFRKSSRSSNNSSATKNDLDNAQTANLAQLLVQKGLVASPAKAHYLLHLARKNNLKDSSLYNMINLASSVSAGQRSSRFEFLFNQALQEGLKTRPILSRVKSDSSNFFPVDLSKFAVGGKYAHVIQNSL